jgi:hypothetical protein
MRRALPVVLVLLLAGCGSAPPPPPKEAPPTAPTARKESKVPDIKGEIGALDEKAVSKTFEKLLRRVEECQDRRRKENDKLDFLAGDVALEVRVKEDGSAREAFLVRSTIGDRVVEKCIVDAAKTASWPQPVGGREGIAKNEFTLPQKSEREAVPWDPSKIEKAVSKSKSQLRACTAGKKGPFVVTAYVDSDGKVIAAGSPQPTDGTDVVADCLADATKGVKMPSPGGWPAKVTFNVE